MNIQEALDWRYAVREFSTQKLKAEQVQHLMEATLKSASSYGLQPYKILVIESREIREVLLPHSFGQQKVADSSHLVVFASDKEIGDKTVDRYIKQLVTVRETSYASVSGYADHMKQVLSAKSELEKREWAKQQAYIALGTFLTAAALMEIDTCPMTGIDHKAFDEVLGLDAYGLETTVIAAIGYRSPDDLSATKRKVRFDYEEMIINY